MSCVACGHAPAPQLHRVRKHNMAVDMLCDRSALRPIKEKGASKEAQVCAPVTSDLGLLVARLELSFCFDRFPLSTVCARSVPLSSHSCKHGAGGHERLMQRPRPRFRRLRLRLLLLLQYKSISRLSQCALQRENQVEQTKGSRWTFKARQLMSQLAEQPAAPTPGCLSRSAGTAL